MSFSRQAPTSSPATPSGAPAACRWRAAAGGSRRTALQFTPAHPSRTAASGPVRVPRAPTPHRPASSRRALRWVYGRVSSPSGRSFVTEAHQTGADVRSLTEALIAHAQGAGGQITSAQVVQTVESAEVTPAQAKKILRALVDAGVTVVVDGSAGTGRRKVAAARAATPASK